LEGIIPALECAHALAYLAKLAPHVSKEATVMLCVSGRGDKDVAHVENLLA
jgi:tryptophan synthase beta chain